jgi:hypothetical protein
VVRTIEKQTPNIVLLEQRVGAKSTATSGQVLGFVPKRLKIL